MTLDSIAARHQCDKAFALTGRNGHGYAVHYERFFEPFRMEPIRLLEIGVDKGASLKVWRDYFPNAHICGVDINPACAGFSQPGTQIVIGDQSNPDFWTAFIRACGSSWHVIIDDGGHFANLIITSFNCLWPHVAPGGFYCVEDIGTGYPNYTQGRILCTEVYMRNCIPPGWPNHKDFFRDKIDEVNLQNTIEFAFFSKELVILKKA